MFEVSHQVFKYGLYLAVAEQNIEENAKVILIHPKELKRITCDGYLSQENFLSGLALLAYNKYRRKGPMIEYHLSY